MSEKLIDALWRLHRNPAADPAPELLAARLDLDEGQRLQLRLLDRWLDEGEAVGGWKLGMTSGASRNAMGDGVRPFGFVLRSRIRADHDRLNMKSLHQGGVENELCFVVGAEMGAGTTTTQARDRIAAAAPGFEINQRRLPGDAAPGLRVADDLSNWGIVAGAPTAVPDDLDKLVVTLYREAGTTDQELGRVASAGHIDDHFVSIATLANRLAEFGRSLQPGQLVITGAYARTPFAPGRYRGNFGAQLGNVFVEISA